MMTAKKNFSERLGWDAQDRVVVIHVDDAGMSHSSNVGTIKAMEEGLATSCSIMMPCSWATEYVHYFQKNPQVDAGLHVTLTSEWEDYRWGPISGKGQTPGLVDEEGCFWKDNPEVVENASPDEVEAEIRAQLDRLLTMGVTPTHLDTHMGVPFSSPEFLQRYIMIGIEHQIPVFLPAGHLQYMKETGAIPEEAPMDMLGMIAEGVWESGLPVLDDCHLTGYDCPIDEKLGCYMDVLKRMEPGLMQIIIHATEPSDAFAAISESGPTRKSDLELMLDPRMKQCIEEEGIILTTWRELAERRKAVS